MAGKEEVTSNDDGSSPAVKYEEALSLTVAVADDERAGHGFVLRLGAGPDSPTWHCCNQGQVDAFRDGFIAALQATGKVIIDLNLQEQRQCH